MLAFLYFGCIVVLIGAPWAGSRIQRRLWRPLPPVGGAKIIPFVRKSV